MSQPPQPTALSAQQLFDNAQRLHAAGELRQAEHLYREILRRDPSHAAAVGALGVIACQTGNLEAGVKLLREALAHAPGDADLNNNLGMALMSMGDAVAARPLFELALTARPRFPEAHFKWRQRVPRGRPACSRRKALSRGAASARRLCRRRQ